MDENRDGSPLALVLSGGGARGAYQVGVLRALGRHFPELRFPLLIGVSAGAINAAFLGAHPGALAEASQSLTDLWSRLEIEDIFHVDSGSLARGFALWTARLAAGSGSVATKVRGLVDNRPLYQTLKRAVSTVDGEIIGIERNLEQGRLRAIALTTLNYTTGQTVTWVQGSHMDPWEDEPRRPIWHTRMTLDHVMASSSLPLFFPAVRLGDAWYGDGGVRLSTPLAPALRLGAERILAISPRYRGSLEEVQRPKVHGYPPPAQILSELLNAIFLDVLDQDVQHLMDLNRLAVKLPPEERDGFRPVQIRVIRPSVDLGALAATYEEYLPKAFRHLTRSLGTRETRKSDLLSFLMFQPDFLKKLIEIGEADAEAQLPEVRELIEGREG